MKKTLVVFLLILMLISAAAPVAYAASYNLVRDNARVFTASELATLEKQAQAISGQYNLDVVIVTTNDPAGYYSATELAIDAYEGYAFAASGVMLLICVNSRDVAVIARGSGNTAFTDYGKDVLLDKHLLPELRNGNYYAAGTVFLDKGREFLSAAAAGTPFDWKTDPDSLYDERLLKLGVVILLPLLIAGGICFAWIAQMKTAKTARAATHYIPMGGFKLTGQQDQYLYRTVTRVIIPKNNDKGGTTIGSGGFSGSSRKF